MAANVDPVTGTITDDLNNAWSYTVAQCTRFVAGALGWIPAGLGNARDWLPNAQAKGLPTLGPTSAPPIGSVAVWSTGEFGHVAEVVGQIPGGFRVAEENFSGGPGVTDVRDVTGSALSGLEGFILKPGLQLAQLPSPLDPATAVAADVGHGLAGAASATTHNVATFLRNQLVPLLVALVVAIVLFGGDESKS